MPDIAMTANTGKRILTSGVAGARVCIDRVSYLFVTVAASKFSDPPIAFRHPDRFMKSVGGEIVRMPEAVRGFRHVLANKTRRCMTIIADGDCMMTRLYPTVVLVVHDVAIRARCWVVTEVGITLRVDKREATNPDGGTQRHSKQHSLKS